jgi:hypothetical protein
MLPLILMQHLQTKKSITFLINVFPKQILIEDKMNREMLKEAIAEAKTIKETAIASAKAALEEAFTPQLTAMFAEKLNEMDENMDEEMTKEMQDENYGEDGLEEDFNLEEILAELGEGEGDEIDGDDMGGMEMPDNDTLEMMIKNILDQEIKAAIEAGEIEAGDNYEEKDEEKGDEDEVEVDDEEVSLEELLAEIDSLSEKDEMEEGFELPRIGVDKAEYEAMLKDAGVTDPNMIQKILYKFLALATKNKEGETVSLGAKDSVSINREAKEMEETINELKKELNEVNLLNAKLLYTNKIFKSKNLTESEKVKVLNTFDKAETVKEVKLVFETLTESFKTTVKKNPIKESLGSASRTVTAAPKQEQIIEVNDAFARMQRLAGLRK